MPTWTILTFKRSNDPRGYRATYYACERDAEGKELRRIGPRYSKISALGAISRATRDFCEQKGREDE